MASAEKSGSGNPVLQALFPGSGDPIPDPITPQTPQTPQTPADVRKELVELEVQAANPAVMTTHTTAAIIFVTKTWALLKMSCVQMGLF
jgi:hypothetical protein